MTKTIHTFMVQFGSFAILLLAALMLCILPCALADDHYAAQNGQTPGSAYTTWETAASNIQDAVNAATTNDMVWVGAGRYTLPPNATNYIGSNVVFIRRPMTVSSSNGSAGAVIIDGEGTNRGVAIQYQESVPNRFILQGLIITNCYATNTGGGVIFRLYPGTGEVRNCVITHNIINYGTNAAGVPDGSRGGGIGAYNESANF